jgi:hypothetical protein
MVSFAEKLPRAYRDSSLNPSRRLTLLTVVTPLACFTGLLLSPKLWLSTRYFPLSPVSAKLPEIPAPFDYFLYVLLLLLLILVAALERRAIYLALFLALALLLGLLDQSRWQPWFFQYVFMLAALCQYNSGSPEQDRRKAMLNSCRLIVAGTFFWSGIQKLNFSFVNRIFPSLIGPYLKFLFGSFSFLPHFLIIVVPLLEIFIGVGLLTRKFRNVAVVTAVIMHLFILMLLVPVRLNSIVWPWNVAMASFVVILFWRDREFSASEVLLPRKLSFQIVVIVLFGVMPLFSFFGLWDSYLSAALFSGNVPNAVIYVSEAQICKTDVTSELCRIPPA